MWQGCDVKERTFLTYLALSTLAIGQPILDLYGRNLTIFSASKMGVVSTTLFLAVVIFLPPLFAIVLDKIARPFGEVVHSATQLLLVRSFLFLFFLALLNTWKVHEDFLVYPVAGIVAFFAGRMFDRSAVFVQWFRWLQILPVVVVGFFVVQAQPIFFPAPVTIAEATIARPDIPVLQVIFDEYPLYSVLDSTGNINAERFPGLATLQREGTWYRNSAAVSNFTHQAVPAILTSRIPATSSSPLLSSHKKNVFTLLGGVMTVDGFEPVTSLCPKSLCANANSEQSNFDVARLGNFLKDALAVYDRRIAPDRTADHLPQVDNGWGGFGVVEDRFKGQWQQGNLAQQENLIVGATKLATAAKPMYQLVHALMPHSPWYLTPDNRVTTVRRRIETSNPTIEDSVRDIYQRYLYQAVASDSALVEAIKILKASGKWNDALVVVTADHGISFVPGERQRITDLKNLEVVDDVYRVPTFIKYPGQTSGAVSDCAVSNLDLLPTIADVLGVKSDWKFLGESIMRGCPARSSRPIESASGERGVLGGGFESARVRAAHYNTLVPSDGGARRIAAVGKSASLIGKRLTGLMKSTANVRWTMEDQDLLRNVSTERGARVPAVLAGGVLLDEPLPMGTEGILMVDGIAAGVAGEFGLGNTYFAYTAIIDYALLTSGSHQVSLVLRDGVTGELTEVGPPTSKK